MDQSWIWLVAVLGFIVLGLFIGYGMQRTRYRTTLDRTRRDSGTRRLYREEEAHRRETTPGEAVPIRPATPRSQPASNPTEAVVPPLDVEEQVEDAQFLERELGLRPHEAVGVVARNGLAPDALRPRVVNRKGEPDLPDPLAGRPIPSSPPTELTSDTDEEAGKPVLHRLNNTTGAG